MLWTEWLLFTCPKARMSEGPHVRRSTCLKVRMSEVSDVRRFNYQKIHIDNQFMLLTYNGNITTNQPPSRPFFTKREDKHIKPWRTLFPWNESGRQNGYISRRFRDISAHFQSRPIYELGPFSIYINLGPLSNSAHFLLITKTNKLGPFLGNIYYYI